MTTPQTRSIAEMTGKYSAEHISAYEQYRANRYSVVGLSETTQRILAREDSGIARELDAHRAKEAEADRAAYAVAAKQITKAAKPAPPAPRRVDAGSLQKMTGLVRDFVFSQDAAAAIAELSVTLGTLERTAPEAAALSLAVLLHLQDMAATHRAFAARLAVLEAQSTDGAR